MSYGLVTTCLYVSLILPSILITSTGKAGAIRRADDLHVCLRLMVSRFTTLHLGAEGGL